MARPPPAAASGDPATSDRRACTWRIASQLRSFSLLGSPAAAPPIAVFAGDATAQPILPCSAPDSTRERSRTEEKNREGICFMGQLSVA
uniref:Uncharacterized protein n=1 Tax=Leersia perrieri TaxID=77586 RepID=A0A0D9XIV5_9ORYZ